MLGFRFRLVIGIRAVHSAGAGWAVAPTRKTNFFSDTEFDFAGLFLVAILVRNLYTGDPFEDVRRLPRRQNILGTALGI